MSFKIFMLQFLGRIHPTEKIEAGRRKLLNDYHEFQRVRESQELKDFLELEKYIHSEEFRQKKKKMKGLRFKGTTEYNQLHEFLKLSKTKHIRRYLAVEGSAELKRYENVKDSEKLTEYFRLKDYVEDGVYRRERDEIKKQVFKGSLEQKHSREFKKLERSKGIKAWLELEASQELKDHEAFSRSEIMKKYLELRDVYGKTKEQEKEYRRLRKDPRIRKYFRFEKSKKLKLYHETSGRYQLKRFNELNELVHSEDFRQKKAWLEDRKKYERSEAHKKYVRCKQLAADGDVKFFLSWSNSKAYKNYLDVKDSFDLIRYRELKELTGTGEFKKRREYLEDKKKWEKSEEYAKEQEYMRKKELPHLVRYFSYKDGKAFDIFKKWEVVLDEKFEKTDWDKNRWSPLSYWAQKLVMENFSQPGDLQCFTNGKNIKTGKPGCIIQVRKENAPGKRWNPAVGFVPEEFAYTSGLLCSAGSYWFDQGWIEVKIKFNPVKEVISSVYLVGEKASPQISLLEMGSGNRIGALRLKNGSVDFEGISLSVLKRGKYYLFGIRRDSHTISFTINEKVVYKMPSEGFQFSGYLNFATIVLHEIPGSALPVDFEISRVTCYREKRTA